jgi:zinc transport system substrate-binding protein
MPKTTDHDHEDEEAITITDMPRRTKHACKNIEHEHGDVDMHVWLDPHNAKAMAHEIAETLAAADPDNAALYEANADARRSARRC